MAQVVSPEDPGLMWSAGSGRGQHGWQVWTLDRDGAIPRSQRDRHGSPLLWVECPLRHAAPDPASACGLALVADLADLLDAIEHRPWTSELHPLRALQRARSLLDALRHGHRPDLLGRCTGPGDRSPRPRRTTRPARAGGRR